MQLDRLAVQLRLRNPWEAIDLGFAMVRTWARPVYAAWLCVFVPLCTLALLLLPPTWAWVLVWWLKPALDRIVLHVLAAGVFGDLPKLRETLRALPRALMPGLLPSLTYYRFFFARSFNLPVWQLERQTGAAARRRRHQLHRRTSNHAVWLTIACLHFELVLGLSAILLYDLLTPALQPDGFQLFQLLTWKNEGLQQVVLTVLAFAAMTVVEPCYVAGGFALYLNRRTALEGWDLEVSLRRMGERAQAAARGTELAAPAMFALVLALALAAPPLRSYAEDTPAAGASAASVPIADADESVPPAAEASAPASAAPQVPPQQRPAARAIKEVLKRPEFDEYRDRTVLQYLGKRAEPKKPKPNDSTALALFIEALAQFLRILAYAVIGLAVVFLIYYLLRRYDLLGRPSSTYVPPDTLFGLDVRPESLPEDVAATALELARAGKLLEALSLLYRGALSTLLHRDGVELVSGDTESDCLRKSRSHLLGTGQSYLAQLLLSWQRLAYARRPVPAAEVEGLCDGWRIHFAGTSAGDSR